jgi:hypothetical protein
MSHSILAADSRSHLKAMTTATVLAISLIVIAGHLYDRTLAQRGEPQPQWACWAQRSGAAEVGCRLRAGRPTRMSLTRTSFATHSR